jgi:hypothetical protein
MQMESGTFGHFLPDGTPSGFFAARIVIPVSDFPRLGLGNHERGGAIPACFRWCHANFGVGGTRWVVRLPPDGDAILYFSEREDALAFFTCWSPDALVEQVSSLSGRTRKPAGRLKALA